MRHEITAVDRGSAAHRAGILPGDVLLRINGEDIIDEIDYQALISNRQLEVELERDGKPMQLSVRKYEVEPMGLHFGESMTLSPRTCHNNCAFCFIAQMPPGLRQTLYVKDDDWRFSLMMGNFVTLTNVNEKEFDRIIRRHASPLYISVHTTDPELRCRLMNNRFAGNIMERLTRLKEVGIHFHCQIVVCPEQNDGEALMRTLSDLRSLAPAAETAALVPVGLTKFRQGLFPLRTFTRDEARALLKMIAPFQEECRRTLGTTFAFPSDEFFCIAGQEVPEEDWYEDFPQIENGVGLLRRQVCEMEEAQKFDDDPPPEGERRYVIPTGVSFAPQLERLVRRFAPPNTEVRVVPVQNHFFGETITVTGLLTGGDILAALTPEVCDGMKEILLCSVTLRHEQDRFLDDMTIDEFRKRAPLPVRLVDCDGQSLYDGLRGRGLY